MKALTHSQIHATCVVLDAGAVLLRGPSGSGKSDLALRLIDKGAKLVADDRVDLRPEGGRVVARAPSPLHGLIEVRGIGIVRLPSVLDAPVALIVDLVGRDEVERLPADQDETLLGVPVPRLAFDPFDGSAPLKIMLALRQVAARGLTASVA